MVGICIEKWKDQMRPKHRTLIWKADGGRGGYEGDWKGENNCVGRNSGKINITEGKQERSTEEGQSTPPLSQR